MQKPLLFSLLLLPFQAVSNCIDAYQEKDYVNAFTLCREESETSADAQFIMASIYAKGQGVSINVEQSLLYLTYAAEQEHAEAMFNLGIAYELGKGVERSLVSAYHWQLSAAQNGFAQSQFKVAEMYENGIGVLADETEAIFWYQKLADQGDSDSQLRLGSLLLESKKSPSISAQGLNYIRQAADQDNDEAQFILASLLMPTKQKEAISWYEKSAQNGNGFAMHNLASVYYNGLDVPKDLDKSKHYAQMAVGAGQKQSRVLLQQILTEQGVSEAYTVTDIETSTEVKVTRAQEIDNSDVNNLNSEVMSEEVTDIAQQLSMHSHVVQLAKMTQQTSVKRFIKKYNLAESEVRILAVDQGAAFLILLPPTMSWQAAKAQLSDLQAELQNLGAWIRNTQSVLALM